MRVLFGLISLICLPLETYSHSSTTTTTTTFCQADAGVCEATFEGNSDQNCQTNESNKEDNESISHDEAFDLAQSLIQRLRGYNGGFFHDKLEIRRRIPGDASSRLGIFATDFIEAEQVLMQFPPESLIQIDYEQSSSSGSFEEDICLLKDELVWELHRGEESEFQDYIDFLLLQTPITIPAAWSNHGQYLLHRMLLDRTEGMERALPPKDMTDFYGIECFSDEDEDEEEDHLLYLTLMNGYDTLMAPVYDIINHSNHPDKINIKNTSIRRRKQGFQVSALVHINKGQELLHSYNRCIDCDADADVFGTPEIFRNHGFIEDYPQRFEIIGGAFNEEDTSFEIVLNNNNSHLTVEWLKEPFFNGGRIPSMRRQLQRLDHFRTEQLLPSKSSLPLMEWELLNEYSETLIVALSLAVSDAELDKFDETYDSEEVDPKKMYMLPEDTHAITKIDKFRDAIYQSETLIWAVDHFKHIDTLQSNYQSIDYFKEPKTKDTCFFIDGIFQMCGSYWPYYHEMQVHKAAKYLTEDIRRVLFVGAGDNGLLGEIVKYPSLELVVGLELDQHVSRMAFKHLAAQPHFDNPKVQWWFGDASKTLFMLPREYFGSFDMVLVDLSDTVLSLTVSGELDVVGALSLLLRPKGIFAMNELFFRRVSDVFQHTIYYQFTNVPKVLDQGFVFASNDVDLLNQDLTNHFVEGQIHVEDSILKTDHRFRHVHDYRQNPNSSSQQICTLDDEDSLEEKTNTWQDTSPGIFMAIEAEQLEISEDFLESRSQVQSKIESVLAKAGFHVVESTKDHMTDNVFVTVMEEGYVTVRLHKEQKYVGFDTLLWSSFGKHETLKKVLVESVGGTIEGDTTLSSFRIVTGGMFGAKTWKEDRKSHGPKVIQKCPTTEAKEEKRFVKPVANNFPIALEGSIHLVQSEEPFHVAVLCAAEEDLPCESIDLLTKHPRVASVVSFYACPESNSSSKEDDKICSISNAVKTIDTAMSFPSFQKIRALVVDPGCPPSMEEVPLAMKQKNLFYESTPNGDDVLLLAMATISSRKDLWRRQLVDKIRRKVAPMDPVFRAHVIFNSTSTDDESTTASSSSSSMELAITSSGDELFIEHLKEAVVTMQDKTDGLFDLHVRNILGGLWRQETRWIFPDKEASKLFYPEDYDHSSAMDQYLSQRPVGVQAVVQLHNLAPLEMNEEVQYTLYLENDETYNSNVKAINDDDSYVVYDVFGEDLALPRFRLTSVNGDEVLNLTAADMNELFTDVFVGESEDNPMYTKTFEGIGEGIVYVAIWEDGQAILVWDGRHTLDINIYCDKLQTYQVIQNRIQGELPSLKIHLLDIHPRGYGHVVNFATDVEDFPTPHWFDDVETDKQGSGAE